VIQIPGYKVLRQLGRGGMATVYLAMQESVDREVALKVMSPALMVDPNFGERFLREARIAAKLHHRHVVGVHDVGKYNDIHYIAMEYLPGGSFHIDDGKPREPTSVLRVVREIATALAYAHSKGFVHRDVKPDNILLHDDGSSALTDFGIARANDSATRMTRTGAVIGTPHYMSPEQARGRPLDGRADLYSLGVVMFELLTGRVPFVADDPLAVGIMHITEPVPRMPSPLEPLQAIVDKMMAKTPEERFQTGEDVATAIRDIELDIAEGELPGLKAPDEGYSRRIFSEASRTQRMPSSRTPIESINRRTEPQLGRVDEVTRMERRPGAPGAAARAAAISAAQGPRRWPWVVVLLLLLGGAGLWFGQDKLRQLLPNSDVSAALAKAQAAMDAGNLVSGDNNARYLYEGVLRIDPDHQVARQGLQRVGEALLEQARLALGRRDFVEAKRLGAIAREILQGGGPLDEFESQLASNEQSHLKVDELLKQAEAALIATNLVGEQGALALYQRAMSVDETNSIALKGLQNALAALAQQADAAIQKGDLATASTAIEEIARVSGNYAALPELRARLAAGQTDAIDALEKDLERAEQFFNEGALISPRGSNALDMFRSVAARDPQNLRAQAGVRRVAARLLEQARAALRDQKIDAASRLAAEARQLDPELEGLRAFATQLRDAGERRDIQDAQRTLDPAQSQNVQKLLDEAAVLVARGDLIDPPGANAYDKYRSVMNIDRNNAEARAGISQLPDSAKGLFEESIKAGRLTAASGYLSVVQQLAASDASLTNMEQRLAQAWLAQGSARLDEGKSEAAGKALANARKLKPDLAGLAEAEARLKAM
jgi:serine/threonine-protein kinase PpkA